MWSIIAFIGSVSSSMKFGSQTSMTFERFALKQTCVSWHVSSILTCSFSMKFIWEVLNSYTNIFGMETFGKKSPRTIQGSLRKNPSSKPRLSRPCPKRLRQMMSHSPVDAPLMGVMGQLLSYGS